MKVIFYEEEVFTTKIVDCKSYGLFIILCLFLYWTQNKKKLSLFLWDDSLLHNYFTKEVFCHIEKFFISSLACQQHFPNLSSTLAEPKQFLLDREPHPVSLFLSLSLSVIWSNNSFVMIKNCSIWERLLTVCKENIFVSGTVSLFLFLPL